MFILVKPCRYDYPLSSAKATPTAVDSRSDPHQISTSVNRHTVDAENGRRLEDGENGNSSGADLIWQRIICCLTNKTKDDATNKANEDEDVPNNFELFANCFIPPVIWLIILFLDGDYLACSLTTWKGHYVFNKELNRKWCQPIEQSRAGNESDLQHEYEMFIGISQFWGYAVLGFLSFLIICKVLHFDCQRRKLKSTVVVDAGKAPDVNDDNNVTNVNNENNGVHVDDENNDAHVDDENNDEHLDDENNDEYDDDENNDEYDDDENNDAHLAVNVPLRKLPRKK